MGLLEMRQRRALEQRKRNGDSFSHPHITAFIVPPITVDFILYFYDFSLLPSERALRPHNSRLQIIIKKNQFINIKNIFIGSVNITEVAAIATAQPISVKCICHIKSPWKEIN